MPEKSRNKALAQDIAQQTLGRNDGYGTKNRKSGLRIQVLDGKSLKLIPCRADYIVPLTGCRVLLLYEGLAPGTYAINQSARHHDNLRAFDASQAPVHSLCLNRIRNHSLRFCE